MTFGNLSSKIRQMPSTHSIVMVALLSIPIKNRNIPQNRLDELHQTNQEVLNEVLWRILQPLTFKQNPGAESRYYNVPCAVGNCWHCKPVLVAWCADCRIYSDLHHLEWHVCSWCDSPMYHLGDDVPADEQHPWRDQNLDRMLSNANTKAANAELS